MIAAHQRIRADAFDNPVLPDAYRRRVKERQLIHEMLGTYILHNTDENIGKVKSVEGREQMPCNDPGYRSAR